MNEQRPWQGFPLGFLFAMHEQSFDEVCRRVNAATLCCDIPKTPREDLHCVIWTRGLERNF